MMHAQISDLHPPDDVMQELVEARVRFLQTLNDPKLATRLNSPDILAFLDLFPEDHARMFPTGVGDSAPEKPGQGGYS
jgi:hypothetical protein